MSPAIFDAFRPATHVLPHGMPCRSLVLLARADPIICGHSTEARNLAEAAIAAEPAAEDAEA